MEPEASNFTSDKFRRVRVLYDYDYKDEADHSDVYMRSDEVFYLLNSDGNEWWQVCRPDSPTKHFYVPRTYVEVLADVGSTSGDYSPKPDDNHHTFIESEMRNNDETNMNSINGPQMELDENEEDDNYMNVPLGLKKVPPGTDSQSNDGSIKVQFVGTYQRPTNLDIDQAGDYANLDDFRKEAGLPVFDQGPSQSSQPPKSPESNYANLQELGFQQQLPDVEKGKFLKSLKDNWEQFMDPGTNRLFYFHKDTNKVQWRPPRGEYHRESEQKRKEGNSPTKSPSSDGDGGRPEFYTPQEPVAPAGHQRNLSTGSGTVGSRVRPQVHPKRIEKARSVMIENLHITGPPSMVNYGPPPPKSATLPSNFAASDVFQVEGSGIRSSTESLNSTQTNSVNINDPIEGWLNKGKIVNGKKSKKWAMVYVKLVGGSNLLFYKDQKSAQPKRDGSLGKHEHIVSLATCSIHKDVQGGLTSKKNTFYLINSEGHILLQADSEAQMQEWFVKLHTRIKELGGNPETPPGQVAAQTPEITKSNSFHNQPSPSNNNTLERKGKIKNVLERFMKDRSDKEKLVKRGIYKDAVFGADLKQICAKEKTKVPTFVNRSIEAIEKRGLHHEGMYRVGGNVSTIQKLRCMVDAGENYDLHDPMWDINVMTGTLKLFFRELKDPLFTCALFDKFLKSFLKEIATDRLKAIKSTVEELPKPHYETVKVLFKHLTNVMEQHRENKMAAHQLAIVFGPTLIWPEIQSGNLATSMVYQSRIVEFILLEYKTIFR